MLVRVRRHLPAAASVLIALGTVTGLVGAGFDASIGVLVSVPLAVASFIVLTRALRGPNWRHERLPLAGRVLLVGAMTVLFVVALLRNPSSPNEASIIVMLGILAVVLAAASSARPVSR
jgi:hypothetical protein